jgi:hypothetical protein
MKAKLVGVAIDAALWLSLLAVANVLSMWALSIVDTIQRF